MFHYIKLPKSMSYKQYIRKTFLQAYDLYEMKPKPDLLDQYLGYHDHFGTFIAILSCEWINDWVL